MATRVSSDDFVAALQRAIEQKIHDAASPIIAEACGKLERSVREQVAGIAATIVRQMSFERLGSDLRITVHFPKEGSR